MRTEGTATPVRYVGQQAVGGKSEKMSLIKKLAVLGVAAEAARRYAKQNPDRARQFTDKAAQFADDRTKGKYRQHIEQARQALANAGGFADPAGGEQPAWGSVPGSAPVTAQAEVITPAPRPTPYKRG